VAKSGGAIPTFIAREKKTVSHEQEKRNVHKQYLCKGISEVSQNKGLMKIIRGLVLDQEGERILREEMSSASRRNFLRKRSRHADEKVD